jgi:hypothetical protein
MPRGFFGRRKGYRLGRHGTVQEQHFERLHGGGTGCTPTALGIDDAVDHAQEHFSENGGADVDAENAGLLAPEERIQGVGVVLPAAVGFAAVEGVGAVLEQQEQHHLAVLEMLGDEVAQRRQRLGMGKVGLTDDLVEDLLAMALEHVHQVVAGATEAVQGGLADAGGFGQLLEGGPGVDDDGIGQRFEQALVGYRRGHRNCSHCLLCRHCEANVSWRPCVEKASFEACLLICLGIRVDPPSPPA